jgi:hypothetical protein
MKQFNIEEILALAGSNDRDINREQKEWSDNQLEIKNEILEPISNEIHPQVEQDQGIIELSNRLNTLLGSNYSKDIKIERL